MYFIHTESELRPQGCLRTVKAYILNVKLCSLQVHHSLKALLGHEGCLGHCLKPEVSVSQNRELPFSTEYNLLISHSYKCPKVSSFSCDCPNSSLSICSTKFKHCSKKVKKTKQKTETKTRRGSSGHQACPEGARLHDCSNPSSTSVFYSSSTGQLRKLY